MNIVKITILLKNNLQTQYNVNQRPHDIFHRKRKKSIPKITKNHDSLKLWTANEILRNKDKLYGNLIYSLKENYRATVIKTG